VLKLIILTINQVNWHSVYFTTFHLTESCVLQSLEFFDNCNQVSAQKSIFTEIMIKADPGVKDFAKTGD